MAVSQSNAYKNEKRNRHKTLNREGMFIAEYVQIKYKAIYHEAATLYNEINKKHPQKPDLRKSTEFRQWKNDMAISNNESTTPIPRQKEYKYVRMMHRDIILNSTTSEMSIAAETPSERPVPTPPEENHQIDGRIAGMTMCLNIPLMQMSSPHSSVLASEEIVMEEGDQTLDPSSIDQALDPSILDQIAPETIEKIIRELQSDPGLKDIMDAVQQEINTEEELIGLTVDLPELDDPLEEELMCW